MGARHALRVHAGPDARLAITCQSGGRDVDDRTFRRWARSSAVEHCLDMAGVTGSIPVAPTIAHHNPLSEFFSLYSHDFVRVACCVPRTRVADAAYNLAETLRLAAEGDKARTAVMVFPELGLSSYAIDDLLLQDALLDEVEAVDRQGRRGLEQALPGPDRRRAAARWPAGSTIPPSSSIAAPSWASCRRSTCRTTASSTRSAISCRAPTSSSTTIEVAGHEAPFGTDLLFRSTGSVAGHLPCRDLRGHLGAGAAVEPRGARRRRAAGQPVGQQHHDRQGRDAPPAVRQPVGALPSRPMPTRRPGPGESTTDLAWDGHAGDLRTGRPARRDRALREGLRPSSRPTSISAASARSGCATTASPTAP